MLGQGSVLKVVLIAAGLISCAVPLSSSALLLGEPVLNSHLGERLRVTIPLKADAGRDLDSRCFSLSRPEKSGDYASYLTDARLELVEAEGEFRLIIRSTLAISEPYLRLLLVENCGQGRLSREFTLLVDPVDYTQARVPVLTPAPASPSRNPPGRNQYAWDVRPGETLRSIANTLYPRQKRMQRRFLRELRSANPEFLELSSDAPLPEDSELRVPVLDSPEPVSGASAKTEVKPRQRRVESPKRTAAPVEQLLSAKPSMPEGGGFLLRLSTAELDLSMIGKMTEEQRQQLREKQLLLDADDQVANTLSMKNRIRQLEEQIDSMQKALEETNTRMRLSEKLATPAARIAEPVSSDKAGSWTDWMANPSFRGLAGGLLIIAFVVSAWWRWRRRQAEARLEAELAHEFSSSEMPEYIPPAIPHAERRQASETRHDGTDLEEDFLSPVTSIFDREGESVTFTEAESVLDEADLYLAYGWANRAIELLQEYLEKHSDDVSLWKKLFEIYAAQEMKQEFEQLALRCQATMDDSSLWVLVQKLGRQLDAANPLYLASPEEREAEAMAEAESAVERDEVPTLDTPLDFILEDKPQEHPQDDNESRHLELDPLFPDLFEKPQKFPEDEGGDKKTG